MMNKKFIQSCFLLSFLTVLFLLPWQAPAHAHNDEIMNNKAINGNNGQSDSSSEGISHAEEVHNHISFHGGQVGMSGDYHIEFVIKENGAYRLYISDFSRNPVDISNASGTLIINPESPEKEILPLYVDEILQEFLAAKGARRENGENIYASCQIHIPGKESIFIEFLATIGAPMKLGTHHQEN